MTDQTGAGWYPDSVDPTLERYWDGQHWTPQTRPIPPPPPSEPPTEGFHVAPAPGRRTPWTLIIGAAVVGLLVIGGVGYAVIMRSDFTAKGSLILTAHDGGVTSSGNDCQGASDSGYDDIRLGAQVTVTDQSGKTIAVSELEQGMYTGSDMCVFPFKVKVPSGKKFYGVTVSHRGMIQFTEKQMKDGPGLTLGD